MEPETSTPTVTFKKQKYYPTFESEAKSVASYLKSLQGNEPAPPPAASPAAGKPVPKLAPIDSTSWEGLNGKAKWDSQVALRGPDLLGSQTLKWFTTSVIRHRLSGVMRVGGLVSDLPFVVLPDGPVVVRRGNPLSFDWSHFVEHVREAAGWLAIPVCLVDPAKWREAFMTSPLSTWDVEKVLVGVAPDPFKSWFVNHLSWNGVKFDLPASNPPVAVVDAAAEIPPTNEEDL